MIMDDRAEDWREIWSLERPERVPSAVVRELEAYGVRVPTKLVLEGATASSKSCGEESCCFGVSLDAEQKTLPYQYRDFSFILPRFFVEAVQFLKGSVDCEGIFRKSGSVARQRKLRATLESGGSLNASNIHDVASLLKQYLRELPSPLLTPPLLPVFEACHELLSPGEDQRRATLLACLLLPSRHLQCLCALCELLSAIAAAEGTSLMDAASLAVIMSPNLTGPPQNMNNTLKTHTAIVRILIENSHLIGCVPPDIANCKKLLESRSLESVLGCEGGVGGEDGEGVEPERYQKIRKHRTVSISGLVMGIGNRLRSKTGGRGPSPSSASPSSLAGTATEHLPPRVSRKGSVKRKGWEIHGTVVKRPALISGAAETPTTNTHRSLFTPLGNRKKRKTLLSRRRHTDQTKPCPLRQQDHHQIFNPPIISGVKLDFANQGSNKVNRSPEKRGGALQRLAHGSLVTPGVARETPSRVRLVGFTALHTSRKPPSGGGREGGEGEAGEERGSGIPDSPLAPPLGSQPSGGLAIKGKNEEVLLEGCSDSGTEPMESSDLVQQQDREPAPVEVCTVTSSRASEPMTRFKSDLLKPVNPPAIPPVPQPNLELQVPIGYTVTRKSFGKRMRCDLNDDDEGQHEVSHLPKRKQSVYEFVTASVLSPINIRTSKSDYQLNSSRGVVEFTPGKLSTSVSHPCFPLSHPHNLLETKKASSPEGRGKGDATTHRFAFTFSNPRLVSAKQKAATRTIGTSECKTPVTCSTECVKAFQSARKVSECNEANLLEEARRNSLMMDSLGPTPQHCGSIHSSPGLDSLGPTPQHCGSIHSSPRLDSLGPTPQHCGSIHSSPRLDDAFLVTPFPRIGQSPNLLEKIKSEIAERHRFSPCTPHPLVEASVQVNDSYKEAVLGENYPFPLPEPLSLRFDTSDIATNVEDTGDMRESEEEDALSGGGEAGGDSAGTEKSGVSIQEMEVAGGDTVERDGRAEIGVEIAGTEKSVVECIGREEGEGWRDKVRVIFVLSADNCSNESTSEDVAEKVQDQEKISTKPRMDAARLQSQAPNLPPPPLSSSVQKTQLRAVKHRQKSKKHSGHKFRTPSASPRLFAFGRSSPWFRSHGHSEFKFNKRAQVYMVPSGSPSDVSAHTSHTSHTSPHHHQSVCHRCSQPHELNKENFCDSVQRECEGVDYVTGVQVKEWIV